MRLPAFADYERFHAWRNDAAQSLPAAIDIARSHGLPSSDPQLFATGTNLVFGLDDRIILKIFPPLLRQQFVAERAALSQLAGRLSMAIPEIVVEGERDGWPYLAITRLSGVLGAAAWPSVPEAQKERLQGRLIGLVHDRSGNAALSHAEPILSNGSAQRRRADTCRASLAADQRQ